MLPKILSFFHIENKVKCIFDFMAIPTEYSLVHETNPHLFTTYFSITKRKRLFDHTENQIWLLGDKLSWEAEDS